MPIELYDFGGTAREVGRQQGEAWRDLIQQRLGEEIIPRYYQLCEADSSFAEQVAQAHDGIAAFVAPHDSLAEEIRGIAEGAAISDEHAWLLTTYNSIFSACSAESSDKAGCTALAFTQAPGGPFLFQTNDGFGSVVTESAEGRRAQMRQETRFHRVARIRYDDGNDLLGVRYAGSAWTVAGVNAAGLALGTASLHPILEKKAVRGLPQHSIFTVVLKQCRSTAEGRQKLLGLPVFGKGCTVVLCDASGEAVGIEKAASYTGFNEAAYGVAYQTNHIRSPQIGAMARATDEAFWQGTYFQNSQRRWERIEAQRPVWSKHDTFEALLEELLRTSTPGAFVQNGTESCQHWLTLWAVSSFPATCEMWISEGEPEKQRFVKFKL